MDAGCFADGSTGWGCVTKNGAGSIILPACRKEAIATDPLLAEALGIRWGLQMALDQHLHEVAILSDALVVVTV